MSTRLLYFVSIGLLTSASLVRGESWGMISFDQRIYTARAVYLISAKAESGKPVYLKGTAKTSATDAIDGLTSSDFESLVIESSHTRLTIDLDAPEPAGTRKPDSKLITKEGVRLRDRDEILSYVQSRIRIDEVMNKRRERWPLTSYQSNRNDPYPLGPLPPRGFLNIHPPKLFPDGMADFEGLTVPPDPEYEESFLTTINAKEALPMERASAVASLVNYPSLENFSLLKSLLNDPDTVEHVITVTTGRERSTMRTRYFPVRQAAYGVLKAFGLDVNYPAGYVLYDPETATVLQRTMR